MGADIFKPTLFLGHVTGAFGNDHVGIALGSAYNAYFPTLHELADDALYGQNILDTNCWFCGSALDGKGRRKENCTFSKSIIIETDYGSVGHKRPSPFPDYQSALDHILAEKVQPQILWHSGHGFYMAFLLDKTVNFSDAKSTAKYEELKCLLNKIFRGDTTTSRDHLFRMPCSLNTKPGCEPVRGEILKWEVFE